MVCVFSLSEIVYCDILETNFIISYKKSKWGLFPTLAEKGNFVDRTLRIAVKKKKNAIFVLKAFSTEIIIFHNLHILNHVDLKKIKLSVNIII